MKVSPASMYLCSSSSPAHNVGRAGNSAPVFVRVGVDCSADVPEGTVKFRGSQKSRSCSETTERGYGEGDGESEGQEFAERSSLALFISEFG